MVDDFAAFELAHPRGTTRLRYGPGAIERGAAELGPEISGRAVFVVSSAPILDLHRSALEPVRRASARFEILEVPDGEAAKTVGVAERVWNELVDRGGRRDSRLVAFGGGSVSDLTGFVAGAFLRGVGWFALPTTLLAQVDAAVGGKTGVDLPAAKNAVGLFHHPIAVLAEPALLATLPPGERRSGAVEVVKVAAILDASLFARVEAELPALLAADDAARPRLVAQAARRKAEVVAADPEESGDRKMLNFGHTLGHALEAEIGYGRILHGDAVAHGIRFALELAVAAGRPGKGAARLGAVLDRLGTPALPELEAAALQARMGSDKKARENGLGWVLMEAIGSGRHGVVVSPETVASTLGAFLRRAGPRPL